MSAWGSSRRLTVNMPGIACLGREVRVERVLASLGITVRFYRARILRVREEAEGSRSNGLRVGAHDLPVFHFQHHCSHRNWDDAHSCSLLRQSLRNAERGQSGFKSFIGSTDVSTSSRVSVSGSGRSPSRCLRVPLVPSRVPSAPRRQPRQACPPVAIAELVAQDRYFLSASP